MLPTLSWKSFMWISIFAWGIWGFTGKLALTRIGWAAAFALLSLTDLLLVFILKPQAFMFKLNMDYLLGLIMAVTGTVGGLCFYLALERGPATVVVPGTALYIVIAAGLAILFLGETMTWNRIVGIGLGFLAIYFLSRG